MAIDVPLRKKVAAHDEAPSQIVDHAFEPRGAWYTQCRHCGLAMAAHSETTIDPRDHIGHSRSNIKIGYFGDDSD